MTGLELPVDRLVETLVYATVKATVIVAMAAMLARSLHRASAATRHLIWTVALGAALVLPAMSALLPAWSAIPVPAFAALRARAADVVLPRESSPSAPQQRTTATPTQTAVHSASAGTVPAISSARPSPSARGPFALMMLWLIGCACGLLRSSWHSWRLRGLVRRATTIDDGACRTIATEVARRRRLRRPVALLTSDDVDLPIVFGILRPRVVLPRDASEWSDSRCYYVLRHELAHVKRGDAGTQLVAQIASAFFWFHPLIWYAARQMRFERERACDDYVLAEGAVPSDYAGDLLSLASARGYAGQYPAALAMARRSQFEGRLLALLDPLARRGTPARWVVAFALGAVLALMVPLAAARLSDVRPDLPAPIEFTAVPAPNPPAAVTQTPDRSVAANPPVVQAQDLFAGCSRSGGSSHSSDSSRSGNNGRKIWNASWRSDDCSFELKSEGDIVFKKDLTGVESISAGGFIDITTEIRHEITRMSIKPDSSGGVTSTFVTGTPDPTWLPRLLLGLDRVSALAIDVRFPRLMQDGGRGAVINEASRMYTDYATAAYLIRLIENVHLDTADLRRAIDVAARMTSDYDVARVLVAIADKYDLSAETGASFLKAGSTLESDYDHARVLMAFMAKASPSREQAAGIIASTLRIQSDYDRARVLVALAGKLTLDGDLLDAYVKSAQGIRSSYDKNRVLAAVGR